MRVGTARLGPRVHDRPERHDARRQSRCDHPIQHRLGPGRTPSVPSSPSAPPPWRQRSAGGRPGPRRNDGVVRNLVRRRESFFLPSSSLSSSSVSSEPVPSLRHLVQERFARPRPPLVVRQSGPRREYGVVHGRVGRRRSFRSVAVDVAVAVFVRALLHEREEGPRLLRRRTIADPGQRGDGRAVRILVGRGEHSRSATAALDHFAQQLRRLFAPFPLSDARCCPDRRLGVRVQQSVAQRQQRGRRGVVVVVVFVVSLLLLRTEFVQTALEIQGDGFGRFVRALGGTG
mmetsp:Transcript_13087/g.38481  ORF Transcript_13087/g.38481 Transcript_13087/m.38481 type:complete len:288 (+) Transcript_13087:392-1255(+)